MTEWWLDPLPTLRTHLYALAPAQQRQLILNDGLLQRQGGDIIAL